MEYQPDDSALTVQGLAFLEANPALMEAAEAVREVTPGDVMRLRKIAPAEMVRMALLVAEARRKAAEKFPWPQKLWAPPEAIEQATAADVAAHKSARICAFAKMGDVWDFCAGIGGDAMALGSQASVVCVEMSPVRAWCLERNTRGLPVRIIQGEVTPGLEVMAGETGKAFHIDPARRAGGKRVHRYDDLMPGAEVIDALMKRFDAGAIKLGPAVDFESLPAGQLEIISSSGSVVQAVLWVGGLAGTGRMATVIRGEASVTIVGEPDEFPPAAPAAMDYIFEVDGAVHRAGLAGTLAAKLKLLALSADAGYLTGGAPVGSMTVAAFRHNQTLGFDERKIVDALRKLPPAGRAVEIKTRGGLDVNTDELQKKWTAAAPCGATVMIYRRDKTSVAASICMREK